MRVRCAQRIGGVIDKMMEQIAAACFDRAIVDLSQVPARADRTPKLVVQLDGKAKQMGLQLRLIGSEETKKVLTAFSDTAQVPFFATVNEARARRCRAPEVSPSVKRRTKRAISSSVIGRSGTCGT